MSTTVEKFRDIAVKKIEKKIPPPEPFILK